MTKRQRRAPTPPDPYQVIPVEPDPIMLPDAAARYIDRTYDYMRQMRRLGIGPDYVYNEATGRYGYRKSALDAWLAARRRRCAGEP